MSSRAPSDGPTEIQLRAARSDDLGFVRQIAREVFLAYGSYDRYLDDWFRDERVSTCVAELEGEAAGFYMLATDEGERAAELLAIAVAPALQSRGVGQAMLDSSISLARSRSRPAQEMRLSVAEGNSRAQRFFARNGFRLGRGVGVYPAGQRALLMVKALNKEGS